MRLTKRVNLKRTKSRRKVPVLLRRQILALEEDHAMGEKQAADRRDIRSVQGLQEIDAPNPRTDRRCQNLDLRVFQRILFSLRAGKSISCSANPRLLFKSHSREYRGGKDEAAVAVTHIRDAAILSSRCECEVQNTKSTTIELTPFRVPLFSPTK
jgi:hypothetical protein